MTEEKEINSQQQTATQDSINETEKNAEAVDNTAEAASPDIPDKTETVAEAKPEATPEVEPEAKPEAKPEETEGKPEDTKASGDSTPEGEKAPVTKEDRPGGSDQRPYQDRRRRDDRGHRGRRGDRPLTNEDKLRMYKKQSEERLLDIKRSREAKVGKKKR